MKLAMMFRDHMVLQRQKIVKIWGTANPKSLICIMFLQQSYTGVADETGTWELEIGPFAETESATMEIFCGEDRMELRDVAVGEVWLCGGQSNMEFYMRYDADMKNEQETCDDSGLRFFDYPEVSYEEQLQEADYTKEYGFWRICNRENLERFGAVGYYFAKSLRKKYQVPVGIIGCNWGGTPSCAWMSEEAIREGGGTPWLEEYEDAVKTLNVSDYTIAFRKEPGNYHTDLFQSRISDMVLFGESIEKIYQEAVKMGIDPSAVQAVMGPYSEKRPTGLYHSMLCQVAPYTLRGFTFYQGESDDGKEGLYQGMFSALIKCWRKLWNEDRLPFLFVQLAPFGAWMDCRGDAFPVIREAQQWTAAHVPDTGMAVISDAGMEFDIHPKKKKPVGERLALLAENKVYGEDIICEAPALESADIEDGRIILHFSDAGTGLFLSDQDAYGNAVRADYPGGLKISQNGVELDVMNLHATAAGDTVIIEGKAISKGMPTLIELGQTGWYIINIYNSACIPARPGKLKI